MKKDITVVTSLVGAGLEKEYLILRDFLMAQGHYVMGVHYTAYNQPLVRSDIAIFLEVVMPQALNIARRNYLVPNSEWWDQKNDAFLPRFDKILCKTKDCYDIWCNKVGPQKCVYTSFEARDIYRPEIPRELKCLHVAGKSEHKNTEAVLRAWRLTPPVRLPHLPQASFLPHLTVVSRNPKFAEQFKPENEFPFHNVTHIYQAKDDEIIQLMNSHQIHVIPSMYEGFGHVIHEGLSCGAAVITTDAAPMNSYDGVWRPGLIHVNSQTKRSLALLSEVLPQTVEEKVRKAVEISDFTSISSAARTAFLKNREEFRAKLLELING